MEEKKINKSKVIVLILSYNGKYLLEDSITSYLKNEYENFEVIVIDNGSDDNTKRYVENNFPTVKVLRLGKNRGYSGGFNFGLKYAFNTKKANYVLVTNNDIKADKKVISELVKIAEADTKIGFVTGKVYYFDNPETIQTVGKKEDILRWNGGHIGNNEIDEGQYDEICERYFADDIFTLVSKNLYDDIGGYDTTFQFQSEEYDWQARAKKTGYKIMYTPFAKIWHKESMTIGKQSAFKAYYDARNPMLVILKHKPPEFFRKYFWWHLKNNILLNSLRVGIKRFEIKKFFKIWQGFFSGIIWGFSNKKLTIRHFL
ncbi:MAG: glycosyltransferase family 2 protein [Bacteroidales bacterium]|nr:glycosyltransferase family 2 protein [Bacteroidales bacterium]